jgi:hypothetical protein
MLKSPCKFYLHGAAFLGQIEGMSARYDITNEMSTTGWSVYDTWTNMPAEVNGHAQIGLALEDADDLADLLNRLYSETVAQRHHH